MNRIIYLLKNDKKEIGMLKKSLELLKTNFLPNNNYPIVIIHENDIQENILNDLRKNIDIKFDEIIIDFKHNQYADKSIDAPKNIYVPGIERGFDIGYRNMCKFFAFEIYKSPELQDTKYYLRLDCDSYFVNLVNYDIFKKMEENDYVYGYNKITTDNPIVSKNLWELSKQYSKSVNVLKVPIDQIPQYYVYYTNFEIAKFDWFLSSGYKKYFEFLDEQNGIYLNRWGDHCIKYLGIEMFLNDSKKYCFNLPYQHGNIFNIV